MALSLICPLSLVLCPSVATATTCICNHPDACDVDGGGGGGGGGGECKPPTNVSNPVNMESYTKEQWATDLSVPVKYGLSLELKRRYSSKWSETQFHLDNLNGNSALGKRWALTYEIYLDSYADGGAPVFDFYPPGGGIIHMATHPSSDVWETNPADGTFPFRLTRSWNGLGYDYRLQKPNGEEFGFDTGHLLSSAGGVTTYVATYWEKDWSTPTQERLTFTYTNSGGYCTKLDRVDAPSGDGRYLQFTYQTGGGQTEHLASVALKTASRTYNSVYYGTNSAGLLFYMKLNALTNTSALLYDYGLQTGTNDGDFTAYDSESRALGRISRMSSNTVKRVSAYNYADQYGETVHSVYRRNPASDAWEVDYQFPGPTTYYSAYIGSGTTKRLAFDLNQWGLPNNRTFTDTGGGAVPVGIYTDRKTGIALRTQQKIKLSGGSFQNTKEYTWDDTNSDLFLKYRVTALKQYQDASTYGTTTTTYDSTYPLKPSKIQNPDGTYVEYTYWGTSDPSYKQGRLKEIHTKLYEINSAIKAAYDYNTDGLVSSVATIDSTTLYTYDSQGNVLTITTNTSGGSGTSDSNVRTYTYNDWSQVRTVVDTHLGTTTYKYSINADDGLGTGNDFFPPRLLTVTNGLGQTSTFTVNDWSQVLTLTDPLSHVTTNTYNGLGLLASVTRGDAEPTLYTESYTYDRQLNLTQFTDGRGKNTTYVYDDYGRLVTEKDHSNANVYQYTYSTDPTCACGSAPNLVASVTKQDGNTINITYNLANQIKTVDYPGGSSPDVTYYYDTTGRVTGVTDERLPFANKYSFTTYDAYGRATAEYHPEGYSKNLFYSSSTSRLEAYKDEDGNITGYSYDSRGRLSSITDQEGGTTTYTYATTSDTAYPVGAAKKVAYGNAASQNYTYDTLGRLNNISHKNASNSQFDYVGLTYNAAGLITQKTRADQMSQYPATTTYTYDNANRLTGEAYNVVWYNYGYRNYTYDDAGNRSQMVQNIPSIYLTKTTTYTYNELNQLTDHTGYNVIGTTGPAVYASLPEFTWDVNGNMTARRLNDNNDGAVNAGDTQWGYTWDYDNRLTNVHREAGVVLGGSSYDVSFAYDTAGRRVLRKGIGASDSLRQRTRYFFQGLTEAIRKVSVGTHSDASFARTVLFDGESTPSGWYSPGVTKVSDTARRSNVYQCSSWTYHGAGFWDSGNGENVTGKRTFSTWVKGSNTTSQFGLHVITSGGRRCLYYLGTTGSPYKSGTQQGFFPLGGTSQNFSSGWTRLERDLQADLVVLWPGETLQTITGVDLGCGSSGTISIDDLSFSNSLTIEHDTLGPGSIGHILRHRTINTSTYAATDTWYHYDQVGSVMSESNSSGVQSTWDWQDAYGNTQSSFSSNQWGGTQSGFHHNTKEYDDDVDLVYMYQRWYCPETGTFLCKSPFERYEEHPYGFAGSAPSALIDPFGLDPAVKCEMPQPTYLADADGGGTPWPPGALPNDPRTWPPNWEPGQAAPTSTPTPTPSPTPSPTPTPTPTPVPAYGGGLAKIGKAIDWGSKLLNFLGLPGRAVSVPLTIGGKTLEHTQGTANTLKSHTDDINNNLGNPTPAPPTPSPSPSPSPSGTPPSAGGGGGGGAGGGGSVRAAASCA